MGRELTYDHLELRKLYGLVSFVSLQLMTSYGGCQPSHGT